VKKKFKSNPEPKPVGATLSLTDVARYLDIGRKTAYRMEAKGLLPAGALLYGTSRKRWLKSDIDRWLASKSTLGDMRATG
jgi:predicted DNA-binding transcriptional regulator AlpA